MLPPLRDAGQSCEYQRPQAAVRDLRPRIGLRLRRLSADVARAADPARHGVWQRAARRVRIRAVLDAEPARTADRRGCASRYLVRPAAWGAALGSAAAHGLGGTDRAVEHRARAGRPLAAARDLSRARDLVRILAPAARVDGVRGRVGVVFAVARAL